MGIRAIIVDDERASRLLLQSKVTKLFPDIEIVGLAESAIEGRELLASHEVDLVYLDISMPNETGFEFLQKIEKPDFEVIFVTGYDEYAIEAINLCAIGYVMKPISERDILNSTNNALNRIQEKKQNTRNLQLLENLSVVNSKSKKIAIPFENEIIFLNIESILYCEGEGGYTNIVCLDKSYTSSYSIGKFNKLLDNYNFFSTHKSYLINLAHISAYKKEGTVILNDKHSIPVSSRRKKEFLEALNST